MASSIADLAALRNGDVGLEISFSNGDYELVELAPVAFKASDLVTAEGRFIAPTVLRRGGEHAEAAPRRRARP
jgi:hypothetical protein